MIPFYLALQKFSIVINTWFFQAVLKRGIYNAEKCSMEIYGNMLTILFEVEDRALA